MWLKHHNDSNVVQAGNTAPTRRSHSFSQEARNLASQVETKWVAVLALVRILEDTGQGEYVMSAVTDFTCDTG